MSKRYRIVVCRGPTCGGKRDSRDVHAAFRDEIARAGVEDRVELTWVSCFGRCFQGPNVLVSEIPEGESDGAYLFATVPFGRGGRSAMYNRMTPEDAAAVVDEHIGNDRIVGRLIEIPQNPRTRTGTDGDPE